MTEPIVRTSQQQREERRRNKTKMPPAPPQSPPAPPPPVPVSPPSRTQPPAPSGPAGTNPAAPTTASVVDYTSVLDKIEANTRPIVDIQTQLSKLYNNDGFGGLINVTTKMNKSFMDFTTKLETVLDRIGGPTSTKVDITVAPVMVNVALSSPDILGYVGPILQKQIITAISDKLAEIFSDDNERSAKIKSMPVQ